MLAAAKLGAQNPSTYLNSSSALQTAAQDYLTANGPANATISDFHACLESGGDCTTASGQTLQVGQFYAKGSATYTPLFNNVSWLPGSNSETLTSSATAGASLQWPTQLTINLVGAKGWYYKHVTLYALPFTNGSAGSTYTSMADWIYQPSSLNTASGSTAPDPQRLGRDRRGQWHDRPDAGSAGVRLWHAERTDLGQPRPICRPLPGRKHHAGALPANQTLDAEELVVGRIYVPHTGCYATQSAAQTAANAKCTGKSGSQLTNCLSTYTPQQENVGYTICSESELNQGSNPAYSSYNAICNPNSGSNASYNSSNTNPWQFVFVNFYPAQAVTNTNVFSTSVSATTMFPCGETVGHEWEDGGSIVGTSYSSALSSATSATTTPQQDFFYTVTTTCGPEPGMAANGYYSTTQTATYGAAPQLVQ